jgi:hypothetical protein
MLLAAALSCLPGGAGAAAPAEDKLTYVQAERRAVDLKQGMTPGEVQKLLGKPRRTALKNTGYSSADAQGTLQWIYTWTGTSQAERNLQVTFVSKSPEAWLVNGWDWSGY